MPLRIEIDFSLIDTLEIELLKILDSKMIICKKILDKLNIKEDLESLYTEQETKLGLYEMIDANNKSLHKPAESLVVINNIIWNTLQIIKCIEKHDKTVVLNMKQKIHKTLKFLQLEKYIKYQDNKDKDILLFWELLRPKYQTMCRLFKDLVDIHTQTPQIIAKLKESSEQLTINDGKILVSSSLTSKQILYPANGQFDDIITNETLTFNCLDSLKFLPIVLFNLEPIENLSFSFLIPQIKSFNKVSILEIWELQPNILDIQSKQISSKINFLYSKTKEVSNSHFKDYIKEHYDNQSFDLEQLVVLLKKYTNKKANVLFIKMLCDNKELIIINISNISSPENFIQEQQLNVSISDLVYSNTFTDQFLNCFWIRETLLHLAYFIKKQNKQKNNISFQTCIEEYSSDNFFINPRNEYTNDFKNIDPYENCMFIPSLLYAMKDKEQTQYKFLFIAHIENFEKVSHNFVLLDFLNKIK